MSTMGRTNSAHIRSQCGNLPTRFILLATHWVYSFIESLILLLRWFRRKLGFYQHNIAILNHKISANEVESSSNTLRLECDAIECAVRNLEKVPVHLVVILGPCAPDYKQLAKFIFWGIATGVGHVSFYDHHGKLKINYNQIKNYVDQEFPSDDAQILWSSELKCKGGATFPSKNGFRRRLVVNFFSPDDGKAQLVELTNQLSHDLKGGCITSPTDISIEMVNHRLQDHFHHTPDPDLAVYFGSVCSSYGLLPWHIRLTEFLPLEVRSINELSAGHFLNCLFKYAKCEQRYGQ